MSGRQSGQIIRVQGFDAKVGVSLAGIAFLHTQDGEKVRLPFLLPEDIYRSMPSGLVEPGPEGTGIGDAGNPPEHCQPHFLLCVICGVLPENTLQITESRGPNLSKRLVNALSSPT